MCYSISYSFGELPAGVDFIIMADQGTLELRSCGSGRRWLDVTLKESKALLLCFYETCKGDATEFKRRLESLRGVLNVAATEIQVDMAGMIMCDGNNYLFTINDVRVR